jgi:hypothetical protein
MFTLLAAERDEPSTSILLRLEKGHTLHANTAGGGKGYTLHVYTIAVENGYTLHINRTGGGKDTPCTSILLVVQRDTSCKPILHGGCMERDTSGKSTLMVAQSDTSCCSCTSTLLVKQRYILHVKLCEVQRDTLHIHTSCCTKRYLNPSHPYSAGG